MGDNPGSLLEPCTCWVNPDPWVVLGGLNFSSGHGLDLGLSLVGWVWVVVLWVGLGSGCCLVGWVVYRLLEKIWVSFILNPKYMLSRLPLFSHRQRLLKTNTIHCHINTTCYYHHKLTVKCF